MLVQAEALHARPEAAGPDVLIRLEGIGRLYGPVVALQDLELELRPGEVHALCGHNGAGKSTLVKILAGHIQPSSGRILMGGEEVRFGSPRDAQGHGVSVVDQELSVVPSLSVADNVLLGGVDTPFFRRRRAGLRELLDEVGLESVAPDDLVADLSTGQRQLVEIARGLSRSAKILILDEPTATLSSVEIERVFAVVRRLAARGRSVVFVSHRLGEVMDLCDRVTVMRDGQKVASADVADITADELVHLMVGDIERAPVERSGRSGDAARGLQVRGLTACGLAEPLDLDVAPGEICALAGQVGSGASQLLRALGGMVPDAAGAVRLAGDSLPLGSPRRTLRSGVLFVSDDRKGEGLFLEKAVGTNLVATRLAELGAMTTTRAAVIARGRELADVVGLDPRRLNLRVSALSGGNQQKVFIGRCMDRPDVRVLLLDEPTRGVDVAGRADIHDLMRKAASAGVAVIFASTDLEELLDVGDSIVTMRAGRIVARSDRTISADRLLAGMTHAEGGVA